MISIGASLLVDKQLVAYAPQTQGFYAKSLICMDVLPGKYPPIKGIAEKVKVA